MVVNKISPDSIQAEVAGLLLFFKEERKRKRLENKAKKSLMPELADVEVIETPEPDEPTNIILEKKIELIEPPSPPILVLNREEISYIASKLRINPYHLTTSYIEQYYPLQHSISVTEFLKGKANKEIQERFRKNAHLIPEHDYLLIHGRTPEYTNYVKNHMPKEQDGRVECYSIDTLSYMLFQRTNQAKHGFEFTGKMHHEGIYSTLFSRIKNALK